MQRFSTSALLAWVAVSTACDIPTNTLSNSITYGFGILIQNPAYPVIHDRYMNLDPAGGGDNHLFLNPVGNPTFNLVLDNGVLEQNIIHAVIDGEYSAVDNTTKMFMTNRGDPKAIFQPVYGCNPDTDDLQIQLAFVTREQSPLGGSICVRVASGNRGYEFRYSPPNNPAFDPTNPCMPVTMVVVPGTGSSSSTSISSGSPSTVASSVSTSVPTGSTTASTSVPVKSSTTSTSSSTQSTPTGPTINGIWTYYQCQTEGTNMRALNSDNFASDTMTLEACATYCKNYQYFGTEYARECYCGNSFSAGSVKAPETDCNFQCKGNPLEICGAGLRLSVYTKGAVLPPPVSSTSTSSPPPTSFTMTPTTSQSFPSSSKSSTTSSPPSSSSSSSNPVASSSSTSSNPVASSSSTSSNPIPSTFTSTTALPSTSTTLFTQTTSSSTSSKSTTTSATSTPSPLPYTDMTALGFAFQGCAPEERRATDGPGRVLTGPLYADDLMTDAKCVTYCKTNGYLYAGTEYTRECWCGNTVAPGRVPPTTVASLAGCSFKCGGDSTQYCGGDAWLSLYKACAAGTPCVNVVFT